MIGSTPISQSGRRVGRLRVRVAAEEDARRAAILLSDALHTASVPFLGSGKMLVVRRLALGRIAVRGSSAGLALQVERVLREVAATAVPFDSPAAQHANAVIFPGCTGAIVALAQRHARGAGTLEWFWRSAVARWRAGLSRGESWLALIEAAHGLPEAVFVAASVVEVAVQAGVENELFAAVPPGHGAAWLQLEGWSATLQKDTGLVVPPLAAQHEEIVRRWQRRWGSTDDRLIWLATMLAVIEQPARTGDPRLLARVAAWLEAASERFGSAPRTIDAQAVNAAGEPFPPHPPPAGKTAAWLAAGCEASAPASCEQAASAAGQQPVQETLLPAENHEERRATPHASHATDHPPPPPAVNTLAGDFTPCAGLLFLVPVLERLGFADFLAAHPVLLESGFPAALLRFVGDRVGLRPGDPLALAIGDGDPSAPAPLGWELPKPAREMLVRPAPRARMDSPLAAWMTVLRRWCRRRARIGLASLARRPGYVAVSRTHLDVSFDLASVDLRVRRCALDADPGWVPWFGRVVRFHYLESHELRA